MFWRINGTEPVLVSRAIMWRVEDESFVVCEKRTLSGLTLRLSQWAIVDTVDYKRHNGRSPLPLSEVPTRTRTLLV